MPPGQRQPQSHSDLNVAGQSSFNIMWHYAKAAERGQRATHIISAPGRLRARCGYLNLSERLAAGVGFLVRCGAQLARSLCCRQRHSFSALTVWPPSLAALAPASTLDQRQPQSRSRSFVTALNGFTSPPPQPRCTGCARLAVASSLLVPVLAIFAPCGPRRGPPCSTSCLAGLASPRPADASPSHSKLRNGSRHNKPRFSNKTSNGSG
ncbi:putative membrane protein [Pectobacterium atrosepticum]|nr:putative membrane protein [Pectobacterium atrosepticum]